MRFRSFVSKTLALSALAYVAACGGDSSGPATSVPTTVTITSPAIALTEIGQTATVTATVLDQNGAEIQDASLTFSSSNALVATVSGGGVVTAAGDGSATITVSAGTASANTTATVRVSTLTIGQPLTGISLADGTERLFEVDVPVGSTAGRVLEFALAGSTGDADLIVRRGAAPSPPSDFDCLSLSAQSSETCAFADALDGRWFVLVQAFSGGGDVTGLAITPRIVDLATAADGVPVQGLSAATNTFTYVTFDVPPATGAPAAANRVIVGNRATEKGDVRFEVLPGRRELTATTGPAATGPEANVPASLSVSLLGGTGDADLIGQPGTLYSRTSAEAPPCVSLEDGNAEQCLVEAPAGGPWIFAIFGFQSFSGVTFTADYDAGVVLDPGTITIQKTVTAFDGGTANNPANPSLAGFEFEVREAGAGAVVTTVTTDASGTAVATVPPGAYDVFETNARGLTDFTSASNGVVVAEAANSAVAWENRQFDPNAGTITIQKSVTSATGGTADGPSNPPLSGFVFEVRAAGGSGVVATVTTDAAGSAVATVSPGSYDIVESNSQGLTDFTTAADGVVVTALTNTEVAWENRQLPNQAPTVTTFFGPSSVRAGEQTIVYFNAGNSTDPNGDTLTYTWSSVTGDFLGGTTGPNTRVAFTGPAATVRVTVDDGRGGVVTESYNVTAAPALPSAGTYDIELVNVATPSPRVQAALDRAVERWERVIRNELGDVNFVPPVASPAQGACGGREVEGVIDDLRIFVNIAPIDGPGSVLGQAGPCFSRPSDGTIIVGGMTFDSEDLEALSTIQLDALILHEMAHVFGIGTLWQFPDRGLLENPSCQGGCTSASPSPDTRYVGSNGSAAWLAFGGLLADGGAPVENGADVPQAAGPGSRDGHWRESTFTIELMTPIVSQSSNPLSLITLASLEDLGLDQIDYSQADDYVLPTLTLGPEIAAARIGGAGGSVHLHDDVVVGPIYVVDEEGAVVRVIEPSR